MDRTCILRLWSLGVATGSHVDDICHLLSTYYVFLGTKSVTNLRDKYTSPTRNSSLERVCNARFHFLLKDENNPPSMESCGDQEGHMKKQGHVPLTLHRQARHIRPRSCSADSRCLEPNGIWFSFFSLGLESQGSGRHRNSTWNLPEMQTV
jgi:hypothetical protein